MWGIDYMQINTDFDAFVKSNDMFLRMIILYNQTRETKQKVVLKQI